MRRYRTEVVIPEDRYVALQLPADLPAGRAVITVSIVEEAVEPVSEHREAEDREEIERLDDIEWWEEFGDDDPETEQGRALASRLGAPEA